MPFLFLYKPKKSSVKVGPMKTIKKNSQKKVTVRFYNFGEENF